MNKRPLFFLFPFIFVLFGFKADGCEGRPTSDDIQAGQQERVLMEGTQATGMPAIKNFRERKLMKMIFEMRDQNDLSTFTYVWSEMQARPLFFCNSIGFGLPYSTQYTNPQKISEYRNNIGYAILPQADPNGLFMPSAAEGTWVMCKDPGGNDVKPVYLEPRVIVSPFPLPQPEASTSALPLTIDAKKPAR